MFVSISTILQEKIKNTEKCSNAKKLRTAEPQQNYLVLIKKNVVVCLQSNFRVNPNIDFCLFIRLVKYLTPSLNKCIVQIIFYCGNSELNNSIRSCFVIGR